MQSYIRKNFIIGLVLTFCMCIGLAHAEEAFASFRSNQVQTLFLFPGTDLIQSSPLTGQVDFEVADINVGRAIEQLPSGTVFEIRRDGRYLIDFGTFTNPETANPAPPSVINLLRQHEGNIGTIVYANVNTANSIICNLEAGDLISLGSNADVKDPIQLFPNVVNSGFINDSAFITFVKLE